MSDPNFFIVGAPKTGTTALCQYLSDHENIFLSEPKELFFWNTDFPGQVAHGRCKNLESYLKKFADARPAHKAVGEGSTHYFVSETAIRNLMTFNPKARVIAMLRNPIDVAYAYHGELVFNFMETEKDFETAWRNQAARVAAGECPGPLPLTAQPRLRGFCQLRAATGAAFRACPARAAACAYLRRHEV